MPVTVRHYDDFDLQLRPAAEGSYEAAVLRSPAGEARQAFALSPSPAEVAVQLPAVETAIVMADDAGVASAIRFGATLFSSLFTGKLLQLYDQSLSQVRSRGRDLRIRLRVLDDPLLAALPWELLYDTRAQRFVALQPDVVLTRTAEAQQPIKDLAVAPPLRVLAMAAQPSDLAALDLERERRHLAHSLARLGDGVELHWVDGQSWRALHDVLQRGEWHIFHFLGHGLFDRTAGSGALAFAGDDGLAELHSAEELSRLLGDHDTLHLVVLNACEGAQGGGSQMDAGIAQQLVRAGVSAVVAMQAPIAEAHAAELTRSFYGALGNGLAIDAAFAEARKALSLVAPGALAWAVPVLVMRSGEDSAHRNSVPMIRRISIPTVPLAAIISALVLISGFVVVGIPFLVKSVAGIEGALSATATPIPTATPTVTPTPFKMGSDTFNIAVSEFDAFDLDGNRVETEDARLIPQLIARQIENEESLKHQIVTIYRMRMSVADLNDGLPMMNSNDVEAFAKRIGAQVLVFGILKQQSPNRWRVQPRFYFDGKSFTRAPELFEEPALGEPIDFRSDNLAAKGDIVDQIADRTNALGHLLVGLVQYERDEPGAYEQATSAFEAILSETQWGRSTKPEGQEVLYHLIGSSYLMRADLAEQDGDVIQREAMLKRAEESFNKGLTYNDHYPRIHGALGVVKWELLPRQPDCSQEESNILQDVENHLTDALSILSETAQPVESVQLSAHSYLGRVYLRRFGCSGSHEELQRALDAYSAVIGLFSTSEQFLYLRLAARAHAEAGLSRMLANRSGLEHELRLNPEMAAYDIAGHFEKAIELAAEAELNSTDGEAATEWIPLHLLVLCDEGRLNEIAGALERDADRFPNPSEMTKTAIEVYRSLSPRQECHDSVVP